MNGKTKQVEFICLEKEDPFNAGWYRWMANEHHDIFGMSEEGTERLFLPPYFFTLKLYPPPH